MATAIGGDGRPGTDAKRIAHGVFRFEAAFRFARNACEADRFSSQAQSSVLAPFVAIPFCGVNLKRKGFNIKAARLFMQVEI